MDHRPTPNEVERIESLAKRQSQNELEADHTVLDSMAASLPGRNDRTRKDQPDFME